MVPYYRLKMPIFYDLERRDWRAAEALEPVAGSTQEVAMMVDWAHAIAHGRLHEADAAKADLAHYDASLAKVKAGPDAYQVEGNGVTIEREEMLGWTEFAEGKNAEAAAELRSAADLQDKVGQGEVDIPAREMLADMLLEAKRPKEALEEYRQALKLSPNRFNGLYGAGMASEGAGDPAEARSFYATLLKSGRTGSARPEIAHARAFVSAAPATARGT
jgi:tetratricopeptide (TPR) repeat protein